VAIQATVNIQSSPCQNVYDHYRYSVAVAVDRVEAPAWRCGG